MTPAEQIKQVVDSIFFPDDVVEVRRVNRVTHKADSTWHKAGDLPELVEMFSTCNAKGWDIYIGANPRPHTGAKGDACIELARCLFVDFDNTMLYDAIQRVTDCGLPDPTVIVESGHGVHCWWRFDEAFTDLDEWRRLQKDLIALLQSDPTIHNPERIMRLPGFTNHKPPTATCTLFNADDRRVYQWASVLPLIPRRQEVPPPPKMDTAPPEATPADDSGFNQCLGAMLRMKMQDGADGSKRLHAAACRCVEWNLSDAESIRCIREYARLRPFPKLWTDAEIAKRLRDAEKKQERGEADAPADEFVSQRFSFAQLQDAYPHLRPPIIDGLLREGEIMNVIGAAKGCKSWLAHSIAVSVATGVKWLDRFQCHARRVLYVDNELHPQTLAKRSSRVVAEMSVARTSVETLIDYEPLRGRLTDIERLGGYFRSIEAGAYGVIILDAAYRFYPEGFDENSNADVTGFFNHLDSYAKQTGAAMILIHHASKGVQGGKAVIDVGAGAGAWARCPDTHLVVRAHKEADVVVFDAANRNEPPMPPFCARWNFPLFTPDDSLDPADILREGRRDKKPAPAPTPAIVTPKRTPEEFARQFVSDEPQEKALILAKSFELDIPDREAMRLLLLAKSQRHIHEWSYPKDRTVYFANRQQTVAESVDVSSHTHARAHSPITPEGGQSASGAGTKRARAKQTNGKAKKARKR